MIYLSLSQPSNERYGSKKPHETSCCRRQQDLAEYLRQILENYGDRVVLAAIGIEALKQIRIDRPALVLSDIIIPEMDGYRLCHRIYSDAATVAMPVILVTHIFDLVDVIKGL
ncbi:MAG: response regulator [Methanomicrobiales archaeon]